MGPPEVVHDEGRRPGVLVANRGEVAVRIIRAAAEVGLRTCAVFSEEDSDAMHVRLADDALPLEGKGPAAYLDGGRILKAAASAGCGLVHPGYGFLSEDPDFARRCEEEGYIFVGPSAEALELFGDKGACRGLAERHGVPVAAATSSPTTVAEARRFWESLGPGSELMVKAAAGGGGRGMSPVRSTELLEQTMRRCSSEALAAFGNGDLYVERLVSPARHVEAQIVGDGSGEVSSLGLRDCSVQRRRQKLVEIAPAPHLGADLERRLAADAAALGRAVGYRGLGTVEFLVSPRGEFVFMEANPRLQVEHTVTEEVLGVDLVATGLRIALGATLADLGLKQSEVPHARGVAIQARVNAERPLPDGTVRPAGGRITLFEAPGGPGVRTDTAAHAGYQASPDFDSLLAKVIVHAGSGGLEAVAQKAARALTELRVDGVQTNAAFLRAILRHPDLLSGAADTRFVEQRIQELLEASEADGEVPPGSPEGVERSPMERQPLEIPDGAAAADSPTAGRVVKLLASEGETVREGEPVAVVSAMKMEHELAAPVTGIIRSVAVSAGEAVYEGDPLVIVEEAEVEAIEEAGQQEADPEAIRPDLAELRRRQGLTRDEARPEAVARRHGKGRRSARENIADLCDAGTFTEYGSLAVAAQSSRRSPEDLMQNTPADGFVCGIAHVNGGYFGDERSRCAVASYDYTVLAGTQGYQGHRKKDRLFALAERQRLPLILFAEGGGGRPGDTDAPMISGLDTEAFALFGRLSGLVPLIGIVSGRCFAGNAALLGCCDTIIATEDATIGMAGPAMIEGGGLGSYRPEEVGPLSVQAANGVVDITADDEAAAVSLARQYLSYFQGPLEDWECADQRLLRSVIPENRLRVYDIRSVIEGLADTGSVLELRRGWAPGIVTALVRIQGRPLGVIANNPAHLGGAIDSEAADKAARFMQLCDAHDLPTLFLCDTPGFMVGPEAERTAQVRHFSRMFVTGASLTVPFFTVVLRKGYGLGAQAMAGGSFRAPVFTVAWPTGEVGGMGLEGAVRLGYRKELDAARDPDERRELYERLVSEAYEHGRAMNAATNFELDDVIDPADTRDRIVSALRSSPQPPPREGKKRPCVDTW